MPSTPVRVAAPVTAPPPDTTENVTGTSGTALPPGSTTFTAGAIAMAVLTVAVSASPATLLIEEAAAGAAFALNVIGVRSATLTESDCAPAVEPSVHVVVATPCTSDGAEAGLTDP